MINQYDINGKYIQSFSKIMDLSPLSDIGRFCLFSLYRFPIRCQDTEGFSAFSLYILHWLDCGIPEMRGGFQVTIRMQELL